MIRGRARATCRTEPHLARARPGRGPHQRSSSTCSPAGRMPSNTHHWHARTHGDLVQHAGDARDFSYGLVRGKPLIIPLHDAADHQNSAVDRRDELKRPCHRVHEQRRLGLEQRIVPVDVVEEPDACGTLVVFLAYEIER